MRKTALAAVAAVGLGFAASTSAAPITPNPTPHHDSNLVEAAWVCGWGFRPNHWGDCVPSHFGH
jgi:hypothetical protein